jgi:hypothetical protein
VGSTVVWSLLTQASAVDLAAAGILPVKPIAWRSTPPPDPPTRSARWRRNAERLLPACHRLLATLATLSLVGPVSFADLNSRSGPIHRPTGPAPLSYLAMLAVTAG